MVLHTWGSRDLETPLRDPFAGSIGVRKLLELLQGGFDCVTGGNVAAVRLSDPQFFHLGNGIVEGSAVFLEEYFET